MADADHITQKQFYDTMTQVEGRITSKIDTVINGLADLNRETGEIKKCVEGHGTRIKVCEGDIKELEKSDRKVTAISTAISTTISATIAAIMDSVRRG